MSARLPVARRRRTRPLGARRPGNVELERRTRSLARCSLPLSPLSRPFSLPHSWSRRTRRGLLRQAGLQLPPVAIEEECERGEHDSRDECSHHQPTMQRPFTTLSGREIERGEERTLSSRRRLTASACDSCERTNHLGKPTAQQRPVRTKRRRTTLRRQRRRRGGGRAGRGGGGG